MTIVCATHATDSSYAAVEVAFDLARHHRQPLWLVRVLKDEGPSRHGFPVDSEALSGLTVLAAALATPGVDIHTAIVHDSFERGLRKFCADKQASLVIVGDSSKRVSMVMASTLDKLSYQIPLPLLVVRDPKPFQAWALGKAPLKVMLALDHTWSSALARNWIARLAEYGAVSLVAAHVWWPEEEYVRRGMGAPAGDEAHEGLAIKLRRETESALAGLPKNVTHRVRFEMSPVNVSALLLDMAQDEQADVVVLATHPHRGSLSRFRSVAHDVLTDAPMSVALIPGASAPRPNPTAPGVAHSR